MVTKYHELKTSLFRLFMSETNDCSVIAVALTCKTSYQDAHSLMDSQGRTIKKPAASKSVLEAIKKTGLTVTEVRDNRQPNGSKFTPITIGNRLTTGNYLCYTRDHVFAVIDGNVEDWCSNKKNHIKTIYEVTT